MSLDTVCSTLAKLLTCDEARRIAANICEVAGAIARGMKKQMADVDLKFIAKQLERMTADIKCIDRNRGAVRRLGDGIAAGDARHACAD